MTGPLPPARKPYQLRRRASPEHDRHADQALVLDHGRIVDRGTHDTLLATPGVYARLYAQLVRSHAA